MEYCFVWDISLSPGILFCYAGQTWSGQTLTNTWDKFSETISKAKNNLY